MGGCNVAVFIDIENIGSDTSFDVKLLINKIKDRGRLIVKRAYADWGRFGILKRQMLENSIEQIEMPSHGSRGKNSADIKLTVDALEVALLKEYVDTFVIVSGDSDYTPLISKLREHNKHVIVVAQKKNVSPLLVGYCDELIFYDSYYDTREVFKLLQRAIACLEADELLPISSAVKNRMKQLDATFDETNYGFSQFRYFLEQAERQGLVTLTSTEDGGYRIKPRSPYTAPPPSPAPPVPPVAPPAEAPGPPSPAAPAVAPLPVAASRAPELPTIVPSGPPSARDNVFNLIYWGIRAARVPGQERLPLSDIAALVRSIDPSFDIRRYGYPKSRGFIGVIKDGEQQGYVKIEAGDQPTSQFVRVLPGLESRYGATTPPPTFDKVRAQWMISRVGFSQDLPALKGLLMTLSQLHNEAQRDGRPPTLKDLTDSLELRQAPEKPRTGLVRTLVRAGALRTIDGAPILEEDVSTVVDYVQPWDHVSAGYREALQRAVLGVFREQLDIAELEPPGPAGEPAAPVSATQVPIAAASAMVPQEAAQQFHAIVRRAGLVFLGPALHRVVLQYIHGVLLTCSQPASRQQLLTCILEGPAAERILAGEATRSQLVRAFQILYRSRCFELTHAEDLTHYELRPEFRNFARLYETNLVTLLRGALAAGLNLSPAQWAELLFGDPQREGESARILALAKQPSAPPVEDDEEGAGRE